MALVNCPECGRENVSDTADTCPACGYNIKAHYDKIKKIEQAKENELRAKERMEATIEKWADEVKMPEKPKHSIGILCIGIFLAAFFLLFLLTEYTYGSIVFGILTVIFIILYATDFNKELTEYQNNLENAEKDFRAYQLEKAHARWEKAQYRPAAPDPSAPRCPHCGSTNIERISTLDRAISVEMVGLASGKIGKQYKCKNCKHMW